MGAYSIGDAINHILDKSKWKPRINELKIKQEWEQIVGKTIARYTKNVTLYNKSLTVYTDVAPLKQELLLGKEQLKQKINEYLKERAVEEVHIR